MPIRKLSTVEAIRQHEAGKLKTPLTEKQIEMMVRCQKCHHYLTRLRSWNMVAKKLQEDFGFKSTTTAYEIINMSMELYGDPLASSKEALKFLYTESHNSVLDQMQMEITKMRNNPEVPASEIMDALDRMSKVAERAHRTSGGGAGEDGFPREKIGKAVIYVIIPNPTDLLDFEDVMDVPYETLPNDLLPEDFRIPNE